MKFLVATVTAAALLAYAVGSMQSGAGRSSQVEPLVLPGGLSAPAPYPGWRPTEVLGPPVAARGHRSPEQPTVAGGEERVELMVRLRERSLAALGRGATVADRMEQAGRIGRAQDRLRDDVHRLGGEELGRLRNVASALLVSIPAQRAPELERLADVATVHPVQNPRLFLSETIPYIGADVARNSGFDGTGVRVAVLDSGIDYTHLHLGGSGAPADFLLAYADPAARDGLFPTNKVVAGFDFVGEAFPGGPLAADDDPIESSVGPGHGTHVAAVLAGTAGVAPGAELIAVKVCSAGTDLACSGVAVLQGIDFALDPDGNPNTDDGADVINLSLGVPYGQPEDAIWAAANAAVAEGIVVVAAAGDGGHRPYVMASPAAAPGVISAGSTTYPTQALTYLNAGGTIVPMLRMNWSTPILPQTGQLFYGSTQATRLGCPVNGSNPFAPGSLVGKFVVVNRGTCTFDLKARNIQNAGGLVAIQANLVPQSKFELPADDPSGNTTVQIPAASVNTLDGNLLKSLNGTFAFVDPGTDDPVPDHVAGNSSSGPNEFGNIKPEILAPGGANSARVGTGIGTSWLMGTSMSSPHVAGSAALLLQQNPGWQPYQVKATLMNNARPDALVYGGMPAAGGSYAGRAAPRTLAGAGVLDVNAALSSEVIAWWAEDPLDITTWTGAVSLLGRHITASRLIETGLHAEGKTLGRHITATRIFSHTDPAESDALDVDFVGQVVIPPPGGGQNLFTHTWTASPLDASPWNLDKGENGFDGAAFAVPEVDGYLTYDLPNSPNDVHLPFQALIKPSAALQAAASQVPQIDSIATAVITETNTLSTRVEWFHLAESSANDFGFTVGDCASLGLPDGCDESPIDLNLVGVRDRTADLDGNGPTLWLEFGVTLHDKPFRAAGFPVQVEVRIDVDMDSVIDYIAYTAPTHVSGIRDGRWAVFLYSYATNQINFAAWLDSDFDTQNWILPVPAAMLGLQAGSQYHWFVNVWDIYRQPSTLWDCSPRPPLGGCGSLVHTHTVGMPRFGVGEDNLSVMLSGGNITNWPITSTLTTSMASPSDLGLFAMIRSAPVGLGSKGFGFVEMGVDDDGDGRGNQDDCLPDNPIVFASPSEVTGLQFSIDINPITKTIVLWNPANPGAGAGTTHRVFIESNGYGPVGAAPDGIFVVQPMTYSWNYPEVPAVGQIQRIMVSAFNPCGDSGLGFDWKGNPRTP